MKGYFYYLLVALALIVLLFVASGNSQTVTPAVVNSVIIPDHPQHADFSALKAEQSLLSGGQSSARGESPLSDFPADVKHETPLGDVARAYRASHVYSGRVVFEAQGVLCGK